MQRFWPLLLWSVAPNRNSGFGPIIKDLVEALLVEVKKNLMEQKYFIGMDLSKGKVDVFVLRDSGQVLARQVVKNGDEQLQAFLSKFLKDQGCDPQELLVCCEVTGIYGAPLQRVCTQMDITLWVEHPVKIKRASTDMRGKSDAKDAERIARYALRYKDLQVKYQEPSPITRQLKIQTGMRDKLIEQRVALENQLQEAKTHDENLYRALQKGYGGVIHKINEQLKQIEDQIQELIDQEASLKKNVDLLTSIKGIGRQNAIHFIIETDNFTRFESAKHLACYAGVVPFPNQSGTINKRQRISHMANQRLKKLLHMAALAGIRHNEDIKTYYSRKVQQGKNKMSVINAVRNKLVHIMWAVIHRQSPYLPNLHTALSI